MNRFGGKLLASTALAGVAAFIMPSGAWAQATGPNAAPAPVAGVPGTRTSDSTDPQSTTPPAKEDPTDIVIIGSIRQSLERAADIKRDALQIVDSIVAEDIGKFPDPSTAAALQRVPGVQVQVGSDSEIGGVRIRGLTDLVTTLDGREIINTVDRQFNLQDLPATALSRVDVIKTSTANLVEGGIAGEIDLQLNKPFYFKKPAIVLTARGNYGTNINKADPQFGFLATDRWNTPIGEIGVLVGVSWRRSTFNRPQLYEAVRRSLATTPFNLPGYASQNVAGGVSNSGYFIRPQANFALQWQASPSLQVYVDGLWTGYRANQQVDFVEAQLFNAGTTVSNITTNNNCFDANVGAAGFNNATGAIQHLCEVTSAVYKNPTAFASTQADRQTRNNYILGGGFKFDRGIGHVKFDVAYQKSKQKDEVFVVDIGKRLAEVDVQSYGPLGGVYTYVGNPLNDPANYAFRNGLNQNFSKAMGEEFQAKLDGSFDVGGLLKQIQYGIRFASRGANYQQLLVNKAAPGGDILLPGQTGALIANYPTLGSNFLSETPGIPGLNNDAEWLGPNPDYLRSAAGRDVLRTIYGLPTGDPAYQPERAFVAREKTTAAYLQVLYKINISGPLTLDGAIGARATNTDRRIEGAGLVSSVIQSRVGKTTNFDLLPNASARLRFGGGYQMRLVYAEAIRRPDFSLLNPGLNYVANFNPNVQNSGNAGNPGLKEQKSRAYDATFEHFFKKGYISIGVYYHDIRDRVITSASPEVIDGITYNISRPRNVGKVRLQGVEAGGQMFFDFLPGFLSGFGGQANFTIADSKIGGGDPLAGQALQGVSKYNYNVGLLYEKFGLSGRLIYNYRSKWADGNATGQTLVRPIGTTYIATEVRPAGRLDFSIGYDVTKQIRVDVGGSNILHNKYRSYFDPIGFNADTRWDDTIYTAGIRVRL
jgi:iron complex outermembrane receptor protein